MFREMKERSAPETGALEARSIATFRPRSASAPKDKISPPERLSQAVSSLFAHLKNRETDADTAERLVDDCIELVEKDREWIENVYARNQELADLATAWTRDIRVIAEALDESLFNFFERDLSALNRSFLRIKGALQEMLSSYPRLWCASAVEEQVA